MATYVCSDIHGQFDAWLRAIKRSNIKLENGDNLIILGDLIDRGTDSLACVNYALELIRRYPDQVTYLMGNHERFFLDFVNIKDPQSINGYIDMEMNGQVWIRNGGKTTMQSILGELPDSLFEIHKLLNEQHADLIQKISKLPYYKVDEHYNCVYVHAGFESNILLKNQDEREMIWIRDPFLEHFEPVKGDILEGKLIVHGHTPVQYIPAHKGTGFYEGKHNICIDGGAAFNENILIVKMDDFTYISESIKNK